MKRQYLENLQQRAQKLLEISSENISEDNQNPLWSLTDRQSSSQNVDLELMKKCIALMNENNNLKQQLRNSEETNQLLQNQLRSMIQSQTEQPVVTTKNIYKNVKQTKQTKLTEQINPPKTKIQDSSISIEIRYRLQIAQQRASNLQQQLQEQKQKNEKLCRFINKEIPSLKDNVCNLTQQIDNCLHDHFANDINYVN